jgi:fructokinase
MTDEPCKSAQKAAMKAAKEAGCLMSFDPNLREPLWKSLDDAKEQIEYGLANCDILKISDNEIQWLTGKEDYDEGIAIVREKYNIPLVLLSLGGEGSRAYHKDIRVEVPAFVREDTIETTGAGDTFGACVLHYVLENGWKEYTKEELTEMIRFANAAASIVTTRKGALRVMPAKEEVEAFLAGK